MTTDAVQNGSPHPTKAPIPQLRRMLVRDEPHQTTDEQLLIFKSETIRVSDKIMVALIYCSLTYENLGESKKAQGE
jgi:hypothetical protein